MGTRSDLLVELSREVLGPRQGPVEILSDDPLTEYIAGVLRPLASEGPTTLEHVDNPDLSEEVGSEDDDDDGPLLSAAPVSPSLDPSKLPRSIGLSFAVGAGCRHYRVCCTWARYEADASGAWMRRPVAYITDWTDVAEESIISVGDDVQLHVRSRPLATGIRKITLYLLNARQCPQGTRATTSDYVFQPQIRVQLDRASELSRLERTQLSAKLKEPPQADADPGEEEQLALLYDERGAYARGHMCGATWRSIDPERDAGALEGERPQAHPFVWTDIGSVTPAEAAAFSPADLRTETLPLHAVQSPDTDWNDEHGQGPELSAEELAECWDAGQLRTRLQPLPHAYRAWLRRLEVQVDGLPHRYKAAAQANIVACEQFLRRLNAAIDLLCDHEDERLAFCFANKAMALQSTWSRGESLTWRPFQLAFLLASLPSTADQAHPDRDVCDLLWFPTGGGKTEAYLALAVFVLGLRRLRLEDGAGTSVITRYTLRLLSIQQFRRTLAVITACEYLRVDGLNRPPGPVGWRPAACDNAQTFLWGRPRFSAGLWVGGNVTPNRLNSIVAQVGSQRHCYLGALDMLQGARPSYDGPDRQLAIRLRGQSVHRSGEPAQVTNCPCCHTLLAVPEGALGQGGIPEGSHRLMVPHALGTPQVHDLAGMRAPGTGVALTSMETVTLAAEAFVTIVGFDVQRGSSLSAQEVDRWWANDAAPVVAGGVLLCARPSRPGYALVRTDARLGPIIDFEVLCPNPACDLNNHHWAESTPVLRSATVITQPSARPTRSPGLADLPAAQHWQDPPLEQGRASPKISRRTPIPACTVDDQVYGKCPTIIVATADKFARLAFEPRAASLFGNVTHYHATEGYYRQGSPSGRAQPSPTFRPHPPGGPGGHHPRHTAVNRFAPPELIIQDELHLIEGPLGSMVGIYESAFEALSTSGSARPKYVASTATIRQAAVQIRALFDRRVAQFPPAGLNIADSFFAVSSEPHPLDETAPGRVYCGVAAPGKGAQTPIVRIWSSLLQKAGADYTSAPGVDTDRFWTLAGYFNAVRELAGAVTLYRQDIPERLRYRFGTAARDIGPDEYMELSSRVDSTELPSRLGLLEQEAGLSVVCATSMFGTGVDINRLGLMVVHGQPKTTATYIQATGRVGRQAGALVVTFLRASRPRDLDHYEFFAGYHRALYRHVEPITVSPYAPKARERALGPLSVALLRQASELGGAAVHEDWRIEQRLPGQLYHSEARRMADHRQDAEVKAIPALMEERAQRQPPDIRPVPGVTLHEAESELDAWQALARHATDRNSFVYAETSMLQAPSRAVVLGDLQHLAADLDQCFENAPQSLREVEETTTFKIER